MRQRSIRGLSPRVRGNPWLHRQPHCPRRSIPACAGEPVAAPHPLKARRVYPRVCGGTNPYAPASGFDPGLSPRVRGNPQRHWGRYPHLGSIPACAGEPQRDAAGVPQRGVYPRVCGGTMAYKRRLRVSRGLSPRVRGNLTALPIIDQCCGSIPACAGEPRCHFCCKSVPSVYPRVCGGTSATARRRAFG